MSTPTQSSLNNAWPVLGAIITTLVVLFLLFDGITKVILLAPVVQASAKLGISENVVLPIGVVLIICTAIYAIPKSAVLGAILLTGYLGGAAAIHVIARSGVFPVGFSIGFSLLAWAGLVLREPRLLGLILYRQ